MSIEKIQLLQILQLMFGGLGLQDQMLKAYINQVFDQFDTDKSGTLDPDEMTRFFNKLFQQLKIGQQVTKEQSLQAIRSIDKNFDGKVDKNQLFQAFKAMLSKAQTSVSQQQPQQPYGYYSQPPPPNYGGYGGYGGYAGYYPPPPQPYGSYPYAPYAQPMYGSQGPMYSSQPQMYGQPPPMYGSQNPYGNSMQYSQTYGQPNPYLKKN